MKVIIQIIKVIPQSQREIKSIEFAAKTLMIDSSCSIYKKDDYVAKSIDQVGRLSSDNSITIMIQIFLRNLHKLSNSSFDLLLCPERKTIKYML